MFFAQLSLSSDHSVRTAPSLYMPLLRPWALFFFWGVSQISLALVIEVKLKPLSNRCKRNLYPPPPTSFERVTKL